MKPRPAVVALGQEATTWIEASGAILGAHLFGPNAGEIVHVVATAMATKSRSPQPILDAIFIHPTLAEGVQSAFEELVTDLPARMAH